MKKTLISILVILLCIIAGGFGMYLYISKNPATFQKIITKSEKKVKIDDKIHQLTQVEQDLFIKKIMILHIF